MVSPDMMSASPTTRRRSGVNVRNPVSGVATPSTELPGAACGVSVVVMEAAVEGDGAGGDPRGMAAAAGVAAGVVVAGVAAAGVVAAGAVVGEA